eukprot:scaffold132840_cov48-Phaeocystis_antarctica.AAC.1
MGRSGEGEELAVSWQSECVAGGRWSGAARTAPVPAPCCAPPLCQRHSGGSRSREDSSSGSCPASQPALAWLGLGLGLGSGLGLGLGLGSGFASKGRESVSRVRRGRKGGAAVRWCGVAEREMQREVQIEGRTMARRGHDGSLCGEGAECSGARSR